MSAQGGIAVTEVIRPAAIIPEDAARSILIGLALDDVKNDGIWDAKPNAWSRWNRPWRNGKPDGQLIGTIEVAYGTPSRYEVTIYRVWITDYGDQLGWTVSGLVDEALAFGNLTLEQCPRSKMPPPPPPVDL